jgi:hypothetical protein
MLEEVWREAVRDWRRLEAAGDRSFEAVCLFSSLGIILSLAFFSETFPVPDVGLMLAKIP